MSFYNFQKTRAAKYGHQCPHCGGNDGNFALNGKCNLCESPLIRYGKEISLLYSLEVFTGFIDHYAEKGSIFEKKEIREMVERTISRLKKNDSKIDVDELTEIQKIFKSGASITSKNTGVTITLNKTETDIFFISEYALNDSDYQGIMGIVSAIQFITVVRFKK